MIINNLLNIYCLLNYYTFVLINSRGRLIVGLAICGLKLLPERVSLGLNGPELKVCSFFFFRLLGSTH